MTSRLLLPVGSFKFSHGFSERYFGPFFPSSLSYRDGGGSGGCFSTAHSSKHKSQCQRRGVRAVSSSLRTPHGLEAVYIFFIMPVVVVLIGLYLGLEVFRSLPADVFRRANGGGGGVIFQRRSKLMAQISSAFVLHGSCI